MMDPFVRTTSLQRITRVLAVSSILALAGQGLASERFVRLERIDGTTINGQWVGSPDGQTIELKTQEARQSVPRHSLRKITFVKPRQKQPPTALGSAELDGNSKAGSALLYLADGGRLQVQLVDPSDAPDAISCHSILGTSLAIPFDHLAGIQFADKEQFPSAHKAFTQSLQNRPPGHDLLVTRDSDGVKKVQGRLERMAAENGSFHFGGQSRNFQNEKIYGIVLAETHAGQTPSYSTTVHLIDGSILSGELNSATTQTLRMATSLGLTVELKLSNVERIDLKSDRIVSLSDLEPIATKVEGLVHRPWPIRRDRNTAGGPLVLGGHVFKRGIGVHSRTELTYKLNGQYEKFVSTIGLDDSVRPRGNVVFSVRSGKKVLFSSGEITGADEPKEVLVDVTGLDQLTLVVDFGDELDIADHANWADARFIKPEQSVQAETRPSGSVPTIRSGTSP